MKRVSDGIAVEIYEVSQDMNATAVLCEEHMSITCHNLSTDTGIHRYLRVTGSILQIHVSLPLSMVWHDFNAVRATIQHDDQMMSNTEVFLLRPQVAKPRGASRAISLSASAHGLNAVINEIPRLHTLAGDSVETMVKLSTERIDEDVSRENLVHEKAVWLSNTYNGVLRIQLELVNITDANIRRPTGPRPEEYDGFNRPTKSAQELNEKGITVKICHLPRDQDDRELFQFERPRVRRSQHLTRFHFHYRTPAQFDFLKRSQAFEVKQMGRHGTAVVRDAEPPGDTADGAQEQSREVVNNSEGPEVAGDEAISEGHDNAGLGTLEEEATRILDVLTTMADSHDPAEMKLADLRAEHALKQEEYYIHRDYHEREMFELNADMLVFEEDRKQRDKDRAELQAEVNAEQDRLRTVVNEIEDLGKRLKRLQEEVSTLEPMKRKREVLVAKIEETRKRMKLV